MIRAVRAPALLLRGRLPQPSPADAPLLIAIVVGIALRFANLHGVPPALDQDEAVTGYDAYSVLLTGRDHNGHPFPIAGFETFGDWNPPLLNFLEIPAVAVFGLSSSTLRGVSATVGVLAIPLTYMLGMELFGRRSSAVVASWLVAVSPWAVHLSRWAIPPTVVPTMTALTMLLMVWTARRRSEPGIVAAALAGGLTLAGYHAMKVYLPLLGLAGLLAFGPVIVRFRKQALVHAAVIFTAISGPILYLAIRDPAGGSRVAQTAAFRGSDFDASVLIGRYFSYFSPDFLFLAGDGDPKHVPPGQGVELLATAPLLLAGILWLVYTAARAREQCDRRSAIFVLGAIVFWPFPGCLTLPAPHALRAVQLIPLAALAAACGGVALWNGARCLLLGARPVAARSVLAGLAILASTASGWELLLRYQNYFAEYPNQVMVGWQYGLEQAFAYARTREAAYNEIWVTDTKEPYVYLLFFAKWPPSEVHRDLVVRREPPEYNHVDAFGKYRFGRLSNITSKRPDFPVLFAVDYPTGGVAYQVRGGTTSDRGRVLWIQRPQ